MSALLVPAEPEVVDLHLALQGLALGGHHRPAQLLQDQPCRLVAREPELSLQLLGRDPGVMGGDQMGGPEQGAQRGAGSVHHRPGRDRGLKSAGRALPEVSAFEHPGATPSATGADKTLWPARRREVVEAGGVSREAVLELHDRAREAWPSHTRTVGRVPDGTGYASLLLFDPPASENVVGLGGAVNRNLERHRKGASGRFRTSRAGEQ